MEKHNKHVAIALSDAMVVSKTIELANCLNEMEIEKLIFMEPNHYFAQPLNKIYLDYVLRGSSNQSSEMVEIQLFASREDNVSWRLNLLKDSGLEVKLVDVESYVIATVIEKMLPEYKTKVLILLILSSESIRLFAYENGKNVYNREDLLEKNQPQALGQEAVAVSSIEKYLIYVKLSLQYFLSSSHLKFIDQILVAGEMKELPYLVLKIYEETDWPTAVADPFKKVAISNTINLDKFKNLAPLFFLALGLVLRQSDEY